METTVPPPDNDKTLLQAVAADDQDALTALYARHGQAVFSHLVMVTKDAH
jgi:hypothetical protein